MSDSRFKMQEFVAHSTKVNCLCFGPKSNQVLATGGEDCKVNIWRVGNVSNIWTLGQNKSPIDCLCFDSEEQCVVSGTTNGSLKVFDLNVGKLARNLGSHPVGVTSVQYHPYGEFIVSGSVDCTMKVWDVRAKCCIQTYNGHTKEVTCVRFSPDGKWVGSASKDGQMQFWDLVAGKLVNSIKLQPVYVRTFEFSPADFTVAAATSMRTVRFWDLDTMEPIGATTSESNALNAIAYSNLGTELYTASKDSLRLWDLEPSLTMRSSVEVGWDKIEDMKISHNYQLVAGSCMSNFVSVWSVDVQEIMASQQEQQQENAHVDLSHDRAAAYNGAGLGGYSYGTNKNATSSVAGAKETDSSHAPARSNNQQQLNDVRRQLSQLSNDLGFGEKASTPSATPRPDSFRYAEAKSDPHFDDADDKAHSSNRSRPSSIAMGADTKSGSSDPTAAPDSPSEVVWESGHSQSQEMATSMGESFWNRFKASQQRKQQGIRPDAGDEVEEEIPDEEDFREDSYDEDSDFGDDADAKDEEDLEYELQKRLSMKEEVGVTNEELEDLLPPSSYGSSVGPRSSGGDRAPSTSGALSAAAQKKTEAAPRGVAPVVRSSPLVTAAPAVVEDSSPALVNYPRKGPAPAVLKAKSPSGNNFEVHYLPNSRAGRGNNNRVATPDVEGVSRVGPSMEVVGLRHARSPHGSGGTPSSAVGSAGGFGRGNGHVGSANGSGGDSEGKKVSDLLEHLLGDGPPARTALAQRLQSLKLLRMLWSRGEIDDVLEQLKVLSEAAAHSASNLATLADFFEAVELRGQVLSLDACVTLVPILENMISLSDGWCSEHVMYATFKSLASLAEAFGELIRNTRATIVVAAGGVDLSREARLHKCNSCYTVFSRVGGRVEQLRRQFRASRSTVEILDVYNDQCMRYFA